MQRALALLLVGGCLVTPAAAGTFIVPLGELVGTYDSDDATAAISYEKNITVDLGRRFSHIDDVRVRLKATVVPALWRGFSLVGYGDIYDLIYVPYLEFLLHPPDSYDGNSTWVKEDGVLDTELVMNSLCNPAWDFLLGGTCDLYFDVSGPLFFATEVVWQVEPCRVEITQAELVVTGTEVPEPAALSLLAFGGLAVIRIAKRKHTPASPRRVFDKLGGCMGRRRLRQ
jgi:hypothetical protein